MATKPHFLPAASVNIGDTIRVHRMSADAVIDTTGTVARREYEGSDRVYYTAGGVEILRWNPAHKPPRVTLLKPGGYEQQTLFDEINERIEG